MTSIIISILFALTTQTQPLDCESYSSRVIEILPSISEVMSESDFASIDDMQNIYNVMLELRQVVYETDDDCPKLHDAWLDFISTRMAIAKVSIMSIEAGSDLLTQLEIIALAEGE